MIGAWISGCRNDAKAQLGHAAHQHLAVLRVAREPGRLPAFGDQLVERGVERDDDVRRRRVAPLRRLLHVRPLIVQVERERGRVAGAALEHRAAGEDEAHAGRPLDALARGGDQRVERHRARVDGDRRERAHRIDDQALAVPRDHRRDLRQRIEDAGRRLAVDQADVRDRRVGGEQPVDVLRRRRHVLGGLERREPAAHHPGELREARAVRAVDQHQHVTVARHQRVDRRLDRKRAAALHRHADVRPFAVDDGEELAPHVGGHRVERVVPRAPVAQHRRLGRQRRGERARREQDGIAGKEAHGDFLSMERAGGRQVTVIGLRHACVRVSSIRVTRAYRRQASRGADDDQRGHRRRRPDVAGVVEVEHGDRRRAAYSARRGTRPPRWSPSR